MPGLVAHACTPGSLVVRAGGFPGVLGWPRIHSEFQTKLDYSVRLQINKKTDKQTNRNRETTNKGESSMVAHLPSMLEAGFDLHHS